MIHQQGFPLNLVEMGTGQMSSDNTEARGAGILLHKNSEITVLKTIKGRYIIMQFKYKTEL